MTATGAIRCRLDVRVIRRHSWAPSPAAVREARQFACEACEWFQRSASRCCFPRIICTSSPARITPWERLAFCPSNRWPGMQVSDR